MWRLFSCELETERSNLRNNLGLERKTKFTRSVRTLEKRADKLERDEKLAVKSDKFILLGTILFFILKTRMIFLTSALIILESVNQCVGIL